MHDQELVDALEGVWQSTIAVCSDLGDKQWHTMTECPGWSVQDNLAHIIGIESTLLGRPNPDHVAPGGPHIKNDVGQLNEIWVDFFRPRPGAEVLDEFRAVISERLAILRGYTDADFAAESWTPVGPGTVRDLIPFRIFDSWAHEQDIRRALDRPGDLESAAARVAMDRIAGALGYVVGKKAKPADGTTIVFDVRGTVGRVVALGVDHGRAHELDHAPAEPTVRITTDVETFLALGCGRWAASRAVDDGIVTFMGDDTIGRRIVGEMNVLF